MCVERYILYILPHANLCASSPTALLLTVVPPCVHPPPPVCRVAQNESTNLMNAENLAIIFAPSLFRPKKPPKPQDLVKELSKAQE